MLNDALRVQMKKALQQFKLQRTKVVTVKEYEDEDIVLDTVIFFDEAYTMLKNARLEFENGKPSGILGLRYAGRERFLLSGVHDEG